jgi:hypothetical protein
VGLAALFTDAADGLRAGRTPDRASAAPAADTIANALTAGSDREGDDATSRLIGAAERTGLPASELTDALAVAAGHLGSRPDDDRWDALIALAAHLQPSGWWSLQPAPLFASELTAALAAEAAVDPTHGPILSALAADPAVHAAASTAVGRPLTTSGYAAYQLDEPSPAQPAHLDRAEYPYILHVVIEHTIPPGVAGSRLITHRPDRVEQITVEPGVGVLLAGRGTIHHWEAVATGEHRTLIAIGLTSVFSTQ